MAKPRTADPEWMRFLISGVVVGAASSGVVITDEEVRRVVVRATPERPWGDAIRDLVRRKAREQGVRRPEPLLEPPVDDETASPPASPVAQIIGLVARLDGIEVELAEVEQALRACRDHDGGDHADCRVIDLMHRKAREQGVEWPDAAR